MSVPPEGATVTWEEFLRFQQAYAGPERFAWIEGRIVSVMAGGSERHDLTVAAVYERLRVRYQGKPCETFQHNRQLKTRRRSYYPDVLVRCGRPADRLFEDDARFVVEVLSPSNSPAERTEMLFDYQGLPSVEAVVFVDTVRRVLTVHRRTEAGWTESGGRLGTVQLGDVTIDMTQLWDEVDEAAWFD